jgi:MYXO-CTERM domain-containing protein
MSGAGSPGAGTSGGGEAGSKPAANDDGGCGCRASGRSRAWMSFVALAALGAIGIRRRRRR